MEVKNDFKQRIVAAIKVDASNYASASKQAVALDVNAAQLSRIKKGDMTNVVSDAKWLSIARRLDISPTDAVQWKTVKTATFEHIHGQLAFCQANSVSSLMCDIADIGKTHTAKYYAKRNKNAVYIDCSQVKSKQNFVRKIAKEFGLNSTGKYADVYSDLIYYLRYIDSPLVILDEAGDLSYPAFLELKALWNATENCCGWYMMGADGLKVKIDRHLSHKKVGYTEIFSRFGNRYQKVSPDGGDALREFKQKQMMQVAKANIEHVDVRKMYAKTQGSLRRTYIEIVKKKAA